ncbi:MAG: LMBR1 domain-containing protein [archaeon]|nr:LMBR1 domain-containing protein [archaeon]
MDDYFWTIILIVECGLCLIISALFICRHIHKDVPFMVYFPSIIIWFFTFALVALLPYDIYYDDKDKSLFLNIIYYSYTTIYYTIFVFAWILIPLLQGYEDSGEFTFKKRMKYSLKTNGYFYLIEFIIAIVAVVVIFIKSSLSIKDLYSLLMDLSYVPGLFLVIFFLSFSFINAPLNIIHSSDIKRNIEYLEWREGCIDNDLSDLRKKLLNCGFKAQKTLDSIEYTNETEEEVKKYKEEIQKYLLDISDNKDIYKIHIAFENNKEEPLKTIEELSELNQNFKTLKLDIKRNIKKEESLYQKWLFLQSLNVYKNKEDSAEKENLCDEYKEGINANLSPEINIKSLSKCNVFYYLTLQPILYKIIVFFLILIIIAVVGMEGLIAFKFFPYSFLLKKFNSIIQVHIIALPLLLFLFFMSFYGLLNLNWIKSYCLYGNRQTDGQSILFFTNYICKMGFALCMNFCEICGDDINTTMKNKFVNKSSVIVFDYINIIMPLTMIIIMALHYYDVFNKIMSCFGFQVFSAHSQDYAELIAEGKEIFMGRNKRGGEYQGIKGEKTEFGIIESVDEDDSERNTKINERRKTFDEA